MVNFLLEHRERYHSYLLLAFTIHLKALQEVLAVQQIDWDKVGIDWDAIMDALGRDKLIRKIGVEEIVRTVGVENLIRAVGTEQALKDLIRLVGKERVRQMLEQLPDTSDTPDTPTTTSPETSSDPA